MPSLLTPDLIPRNGSIVTMDGAGGIAQPLLLVELG